MGLPQVLDPVVIVVTRAEVQTGDTSRVTEMLQALLASPDTARSFRERLDIAFDGYNDGRRKLEEIPEVRDFVFKLDEQFSYSLFFLSKHCLGLQRPLYWMLPPFLTDAARARIDTERTRNCLLLNRCVPGLNYIAGYVGLTEQELEQMNGRAVDYLVSGPLRGHSRRVSARSVGAATGRGARRLLVRPIGRRAPQGRGPSAPQPGIGSAAELLWQRHRKPFRKRGISARTHGHGAGPDRLPK